MILSLGRQYAQKADAFASSEMWVNDVYYIIRNLSEFGVIVDLGCNTGRFIEYASRELINATFYGVDINEEALKIAEERKIKGFFVTDIKNVPDEVNTVVCLHSIMQMDNPYLVFMDVWKKLKRGGKLIVLTHNKLNKWLWFIPNLFSGYRADSMIRNRHTRGELKQFFYDMGFVCTELRYHNQNWFTRIFPMFSKHIWYEGRKG